MPDCRHIVRNYYACQTTATPKCGIPDLRYALGNRIRSQTCRSERVQTAINYQTSMVQRSEFSIKSVQTAAIGECGGPNLRYAVGNRDACQTAAMVECAVSDCHHTVGNFYACQTATTGKCEPPDHRHAVGNRYACQTTATPECIGPDRRHTVGNFYTCQAATTGKCVASDSFQCLR